MAKSSVDRLPRDFGSYVLLRQIAQGGMGQVYLALSTQGDVDEVCVVKTVRPDLAMDREAQGRFLDEARLVVSLEHPCICRTFDVGRVDETGYLAMELLSGRNLRDLTSRAQQKNVALPLPVVVHLGARMLAGVGYAHGARDPRTGMQLSIVHRDLSPHNVMIGFDGSVKVIDFGLAMHANKVEVTKTGVMVGKLRYGAPEQVRDRAMDGRADIFSIGVILAELFTNARLYGGLSEEKIWKAASRGGRRPAGFEALDPSLRRVLDTALAEDPRDRYATCEEMRGDLLSFAGASRIGDGLAQTGAVMESLFPDEKRAEARIIQQSAQLAIAHTQERARGLPAHTEVRSTGEGDGPSWLAELRDLDTQFEEGEAFNQGETSVDPDPRQRGEGGVRVVAPAEPGPAMFDAPRSLTPFVVAGAAMLVVAASLWIAIPALGRHLNAPGADRPGQGVSVAMLDDDARAARTKLVIVEHGAPRPPAMGDDGRPPTTGDAPSPAIAPAAAPSPAAAPPVDDPIAAADEDDEDKDDAPRTKRAGRTRPKRPTVARIERDRAPPPAAPPPVATGPKTMKEKMDVLGACSALCAAPLRETYKRVSTLSILEARAFVDDVNKCVARCR